MKKQDNGKIKVIVVKKGKSTESSDLIYSCCRKSQRGLPGPPQG